MKSFLLAVLLINCLVNACEVHQEGCLPKNDYVCIAHKLFKYKVFIKLEPTRILNKLSNVMQAIKSGEIEGCDKIIRKLGIGGEMLVIQLCEYVLEYAKNKYSLISLPANMIKLNKVSIEIEDRLQIVYNLIATYIEEFPPIKRRHSI